MKYCIINRTDGMTISMNCLLNRIENSSVEAFYYLLNIKPLPTELIHGRGF